MALTIFTSAIGEGVKVIEKHIPLELGKISVHTVYQVSADGHELAHIFTQFRNLPVKWSDFNSEEPAPRGYVMNWYGDHAKFIVGNL